MWSHKSPCSTACKNDLALPEKPDKEQKGMVAHHSRGLSRAGDRTLVTFALLPNKWVSSSTLPLPRQPYSLLEDQWESNNSSSADTAILQIMSG